MMFSVLFEDGTIATVPYTRDLSDTIQFESYVRKERPLTPLLYTLSDWKRVLRESYKDVLGVAPGDCCYVDLRAWGNDYFQLLALPGGVRYVVECRYIRWEGKGRRRIVLGCKLFRKEFAWGAFDVYAYGTCFQLTDGMVLVDLDFCKLYPAILE